jgi:hypothetical protein
MDMTEYHLRQVKTALENQGLKYGRYWYAIDQEQRRRNIGLTDKQTVQRGTDDNGTTNRPDGQKG